MSSTPYFSIKIEGDFIDSFIYSGTLFLVHSSSTITTHNWETLIDTAITDNWGAGKNRTIAAFLKDCRVGPPSTNSKNTITIETDRLIENTISTLQLNGWPTDINLYSNNLLQNIPKRGASNRHCCGKEWSDRGISKRRIH